MGLILLLLGVSPLLNSDIYSVKDQFCVKETDFQAKFNGVYQDIKQGSVSLFYLPSRDGKGKGNSFKSVKSVKSVKISFKHSIEWHLKEIKEIKRPKNLITFCFHSSFKTSCVCCVFRPAAGCLRTPRRVKGGSNCFFQPFSNVLFIII